jgi:hypothetical protein
VGWFFLSNKGFGFNISPEITIRWFYCVGYCRWHYFLAVHFTVKITRDGSNGISGLSCFEFLLRDAKKTILVGCA